MYIEVEMGVGKVKVGSVDYTDGKWVDLDGYRYFLVIISVNSTSSI